jgi:hypothetical protein
MDVYERGEVIKGVVDAPQPLGSIVPLFVLEEELSRLGRCLSEGSTPR